MEKPVYYKIEQVADILGIPSRSVYDLIYQGHLKAVRVGPRRIRIPQEALLNLPPWEKRNNKSA
ncbi:helix-turn-helix domain-containing protein [Caldanaerobius polysaccharolyticus]|uniref:helix-turn-helix domain-containing protein n=1 Tax=Caldanaerobius polysaccharolyticus TaxID=44256 RepID=UPI00055776DE|nr:helix-turn-helix domain-containing protein [Caldanaerobius polysaccharolyticus]